MDLTGVVAVPSVKNVRLMMLTTGILRKKLNFPTFPVDKRVDLRFTFDCPYGAEVNFNAVTLFRKWPDPADMDGSLVPFDVAIHPENRLLPMTYGHEIGHLIDLYCFEDYKHQFSSHLNPLYNQWWEAVSSSEAIRLLAEPKASVERQAAEEGTELTADSVVYLDIRDQETGTTKTVPVTYGALKEAISAHELWARSFCQWVFNDCESTSLRELFEAELASDENTAWGLYFHSHEWTPVRDAITGIMKHQGWLKRQ